MADLEFIVKDPGTAYVSNNLIIPKSCGLEKQIKHALTFVYGEENVYEPETNVLLGKQPATLKLWDETKSHLVVPREFLDHKERRNFKFPFIDVQPKEFQHFGLKDLIQLRDEDQERAFQALLNHESGTLNLSCGKGKTVLALKLFAYLDVPTIVVVNSTALLEQWKLEAEKLLGLTDIGTVQGEIADWVGKPLVLAMVHTLSGHRDEWTAEFRRNFGLVFYDEGHHMSAPVFTKSADLFFGRRYGLTATAIRTDGMEAIYQYHLGRIIHSNLTQDLVPNTFFHRLKWELDPRDKEFITDKSGEVNLNLVRGFLGKLDWRNQIIYEDILKDLDRGRNMLILSHSVEHVDLLYELLKGYGAGKITGATPQDLRIKTLRESNPVLGTFQLAREGLNKPELDMLYVVTPFGNSNDMQQAWGRTQRQLEGKPQPEVRVYEDTALDCSVRSCRSLRKFLDKFDYPYKVLKLAGGLNGPG
jgi:superfamily II DNA or RNA helicase